MPQYAQIDPAAVDPKPVIGWYDTDAETYPELPPKKALVAITADQYAGRTMNPAGWMVVAGVLTSAPETAPIAYVPNWLVRERLQDAGKWDAAVAAMSPAQQIEFATLQLGIDPADETVIALLTDIGVPNPAAILGPQA